MNFVRNKIRLKGDMNHVIKHLTLYDAIIKWSKVVPTQIDKDQFQRVDWKVTYDGAHIIDCQFHVMRCAIKTEYCTEVHLVAMVSEEDHAQIDVFSKALLEALRVHYNKAWVIGDNELNASIFRESY